MNAAENRVGQSWIGYRYRMKNAPKPNQPWFPVLERRTEMQNKVPPRPLSLCMFCTYRIVSYRIDVNLKAQQLSWFDLYSRRLERRKSLVWPVCWNVLLFRFIFFDACFYCKKCLYPYISSYYHYCIVNVSIKCKCVIALLQHFSFCFESKFELSIVASTKPWLVMGLQAE